jgi:hypothetical protein
VVNAFENMRQLIILTITMILLSCHEDKVDKIENCSLSKANGIRNLKFMHIVSPDSLTINFQNVKHELRGYSASVIERFYDYKLNRRTISFGNIDDNLECSVTMYYPGDSSFFNNNSYIGEFEIRNSDTKNDRTADSLVFVKQCSFNFYLELTKLSGEKFKTVDRTDLSSNFYQIDSIKYIKRDKFEYSQYKVYGHFKTLIVGSNNKEESVAGELRMQFETKKN